MSYLLFSITYFHLYSPLLSSLLPSSPSSVFVSSKRLLLYRLCSIMFIVHQRLDSGYTLCPPVFLLTHLPADQSVTMFPLYSRFLTHSLLSCSVSFLLLCISNYTALALALALISLHHIRAVWKLSNTPLPRLTVLIFPSHYITFSYYLSPLLISLLPSLCFACQGLRG